MKLLGIHPWARLPLIDWEVIGLGSDCVAFRSFFRASMGEYTTAEWSATGRFCLVAMGGAAGGRGILQKPEKKVERVTLDPN
jgi:hypothetical protein